MWVLRANPGGHWALTQAPLAHLHVAVQGPNLGRHGRILALQLVQVAPFQLGVGGDTRCERSKSTTHLRTAPGSRKHSRPDAPGWLCTRRCQTRRCLWTPPRGTGCCWPRCQPCSRRTAATARASPSLRRPDHPPWSWLSRLTPSGPPSARRHLRPDKLPAGGRCPSALAATSSLVYTAHPLSRKTMRSQSLCNAEALAPMTPQVELEARALPITPPRALSGGRPPLM